MSAKIVDKFAKSLIHTAHDTPLGQCEQVLAGDSTVPSRQAYQNQLQSLTVEQKEAVRKLVHDLVEGCLHNLLFYLDSEENYSIHIRVEEKEIDLATLLDRTFRTY